MSKSFPSPDEECRDAEGFKCGGWPEETLFRPKTKERASKGCTVRRSALTGRIRFQPKTDVGNNGREHREQTAHTTKTSNPQGFERWFRKAYDYLLTCVAS